MLDEHVAVKGGYCLTVYFGVRCFSLMLLSCIAFRKTTMVVVYFAVILVLFMSYC